MLRATLSPEAGIAADVHPLGYYLLLWGWGSLFGTSPLAMRMLSVLAGLGLVGLAYRLARETFGPQLAYWVGGLAALSPFQVHYAQEIRMYGLLALELVAAVIAFRGAVRSGSPAQWLAFALLAAAAQYTHALAALFLLPLASIALFLRDRRVLGATVISGAVAVLLYLPWLVNLPAQFGRVQAAYWIPAPGAGEVLRTLVIYVGGSPLPAWGVPIALFALIFVAALGAWALRRAWREGSTDARVAGAAAFLAIAPLLLMALISLWQPIYLDRAMLPAGTAFLFWLAWLLGGDALPARLRWTARALVGISFAVGLFGYWAYRGFPYAPFQDLLAVVGDQRREGEVVLHSNKLTMLPSAYFAPGLSQEYLADPPGSGSDTLALATQRELGLFAWPDAASAVGPAQGVWFVIFGRELQEYATLGVAEHPAMGWLRARFASDQRSDFGDVQLHHFSVRRTTDGQ
jgi:hypothetical protein